MALRIAIDDPLRPEVLAVLEEHLADMRATSPPESVHALDPVALTDAAITFWTASDGDTVLGTAALKVHTPTHAELKSMRTSADARGRGVGTALLRVVLTEAAARHIGRVSLETGSEPFFAPARRLYIRHGFTPCAPFADYRDDPNSVYLSRVVDTYPIGQARRFS